MSEREWGEKTGLTTSHAEEEGDVNKSLASHEDLDNKLLLGPQLR